MSAPSGYTALDFVGFTDKGTYSPIVKYMRNDLVHHGGNIMRCKVDDTMNVTPVEGANWELWIGASANLAERTIAPLENNPADVAFGVGRQIIYDDWLWEVIAPIAVGDALIDYAVDPTNANIKKSAPVETQLLAVKAEADATDNMIAPTEANASSSSAPYSVGDQLILDNILYDVIAAIQIGDALTTGTGGNIAAADTLTDQLNAKANSSDLAAVATSGAFSDLSGTPTLGTAAAKDSTNAVTSGSTDLVESGAVYTEIQTLTTESITFEKKAPKDRHIVIVGDSYADTNPTDFAYIIRDSNIFKNVDLVVGGGWGFTGKEGAPGGTTGTSLEWLTHFRNFVNGLTEDYINDIDDVYIVGGFNDHYSDSSTILSHMSEFFTYAHSALPHAKFHLALCAWAAPGTVTTPNETVSGAYLRARISQVVLYAYEQCPRYGCEFLGHMIHCLHNYQNDFDSSLYHPSEAAEQRIATTLLNMILGTAHNYGETAGCLWNISGSTFNIFNYRIHEEYIDIYASAVAQITANATSVYTAPLYYTILSSVNPNGSDGQSNVIGGRYGANMILIPVIIRNGTQQKRDAAWIYINPDEQVVLATTYEIAANDVMSLYVLNTKLSVFDC